MKRQIKVIELADGEITLNIEEAQRMRAITEIAMAINKLASALSATPEVTIEDCRFGDLSSAGVVIKSVEEDDA